MKVPPKRKGNRWRDPAVASISSPLNESPSEKEGKSDNTKLPTETVTRALNESPSEKEGKSPITKKVEGKDRDPQ